MRRPKSAYLSDRSPKGTRIPVQAIFSNLAAALAIEEVIEAFPSATRERIDDLMAFVALSLEKAPSYE
ncbi:MAG: DUF433 domain-containing protein [Bryobacteraceae bacterium]